MHKAAEASIRCGAHTRTQAALVKASPLVKRPSMGDDADVLAPAWSWSLPLLSVPRPGGKHQASGR